MILPQIAYQQALQLLAVNFIESGTATVYSSSTVLPKGNQSVIVNYNQSHTINPTVTLMNNKYQNSLGLTYTSYFLEITT